MSAENRANTFRGCTLAEVTHLSLEGVYDEVQRVRLDALDALLDHVVTVLVLHTLQHVAVQLPHHLTLRGRTDGGKGGEQRGGRESGKQEM